MVYLATRPWQLGDLATWISAVSGVVTVILALVASIVGYRVYKVESGRDARAEQDRRERAADDRRRQAALVSVWYGRSIKPERSFGVGGFSSYSWGGWIVNASDAPVYNAILRFYRPGAEALRVTTWATDPIKVVPPYRGESMVPIGEDSPDDLTTEEYEGGLEVSLQFRDAAGRHWLRDRQGYLHELPQTSG
ncbi:hypothetical protein [Micromonospora sp. NPDC004551]|uniref:hypothetical protein n=1 Tax=Micromonospora sp. NPDC004551 TaxID=3154284 RepID=UPI0033A72EFE